MTQYAYFDSTAPSPAPVLGWYDTGVLNYPNMPPPTDLLEMTAIQWAGRLVGYWAVADGVLVPYAPPPPVLTPEQQAAQAYADFIAGGLTITSTATPALSGVYAIDAARQTDIATEAQFISTFAEFTTGTTTNLPWPMPDGTTNVFPTTAAFLAFAKAAAMAVAAAKVALAQGAAMPPATATIP